MTWTQLLTPPLTILLVGWLAKRARRPGPVANGWHIVRYAPVFRWLSAALCVAMLTCGIVLIPSILEGRRAPTRTLVFAMPVILVPGLLSIYGILRFAMRDSIKRSFTTGRNRSSGPIRFERTPARAGTVYSSVMASPTACTDSRNYIPR